MEITTRSVLGLAVVAAGAPEVIAGHAYLDAPVRWVHVTEQLEIAELLQGGELILTTGLMIGADPDAAARQIAQLTQAGAAGLVVELPPGREPTLAALRGACAEAALPVVVLRSRVRFVDLTEAVHRLIVAEQLEQLERSRRVHERFTELALNQASPQQIVDAAAAMLDSPVVLRDARGRVLAHAAAGRAEAEVLGAPAGDSAVPVLLRGSHWGVVCAPELGARDAAHVLDRASQALTLHLLAERDERDLSLLAQSTLLNELAHGGAADAEAAAARAAGLGLPPGAHYVPLVVHRPSRDAERAVASADSLHAATEDAGGARADRALQEALWEAASELSHGAIVGWIGADRLAALLAVCGPASAAPALDRIAAALQGLDARTLAHGWRLGTAPSDAELGAAAHRLHEAAQIAEAAARLGRAERPWFRAADVRLSGLAAMLAEDPRAATFLRSELGPLLERGPAATEELAFLRAVVESGGNKTAVSASTFLSRPAVYHRISRLEERLGVSLAEPGSLASLHLALLLLDAGASISAHGTMSGPTATS